VAATLPIADAARSRVGKSRSSSASPAAAATAKDAVASAVVPGSEAMADAEMASQTFVRRRGCPGWCRERKRAAVLFWFLGAILRVWYRGEPFCLFLCFVCLSKYLEDCRRSTVFCTPTLFQSPVLIYPQKPPW
jgi:hypothetical protein